MKDLKYASVVIPLHPYSALIFVLCRRQMYGGEIQLIIVISARWWFQLPLLCQMLFYPLSKLIHPMIPGMQLLICKYLFFHTCPSGPPEAICFQLARQTMHLYCSSLGVYQLSSPMSKFNLKGSWSFFLPEDNTLYITLCWLNLVNEK